VGHEFVVAGLPRLGEEGGIGPLLEVLLELGKSCDDLVRLIGRPAAEPVQVAS
tara:strand:- start:472 stop:630 length:159 start_codon:yes stop_codon:yes gene_type:complete